MTEVRRLLQAVTGVWEQILVSLGRLHLGGVLLLSCDNSLGDVGCREGSSTRGGGRVQIGTALQKAGLQNMMDCFHCNSLLPAGKWLRTGTRILTARL